MTWQIFHGLAPLVLWCRGIKDRAGTDHGGAGTDHGGAGADHGGAGADHGGAGADHGQSDNGGGAVPGGHGGADSGSLQDLPQDGAEVGEKPSGPLLKGGGGEGS